MANGVTTPAVAVYPDISGPVLCQLSASALATKYSGLTQKTATRDFAITHRTQHLSFKKDVPVMCTADLVSALTAASAPVV